MSSTHKIVVGVDYGASYVSTASHDIKDIIVIGTWPGPARDTETVFKTPSRIAYPADNPRIQHSRWGFQVEPGMTAYSWTKLLLDGNTPLTKFDDATLEDASAMGIMGLPEGKSAADVVADFLTEVHDHIFKLIEKQITEETLRITPVEYWFTVPAIWSDQAKAHTKQAAQRAGFGSSLARPDDKIFMITEPEAAAIAALKKTTTDGLGASVKAGDGVLVCDCGGGTVDITTYLINQVNPALSFEELCTGIGGKCGSTAIDRNFYHLMSTRFGEAFDKLPPKKKGPGSEFMKKFEFVKKDFGYSTFEEEVHEIPLNMTVHDPDPDHFDEEERHVLITNDDLRQMFDPVVDQIIGLVRRQIDDANADAERIKINRIILVGGFGDSEYLRRAFKAKFRDITITVPDNPQATIVRGAALRGLHGLQPTTKRCRRHYGFCWSIPFREGIDDEKHSFIDDFTGIKMVQGIMDWAIAKGEKYTDGRLYSVFFEQTHASSDPLLSTFSLYSCDLKEAPKRIEGEGIRKVGIITMDLTDVDMSLFQSKIVAGKVMYKLQCWVKVIFGAQDGVLRFETSSQGRVIGKTTIDFTSTKYY
ncbi:uncharacterized protein GIQ15_06651 [Arthroderma uncinatum]|uniref:uncharacterized protein n=1 Tax=Arthroderma uncinatum TaxID=74035 RepID=UPI00144AB3F7|nr:uncharacterized protein GIQ15_06651 [Arthroderma uncinatum]KAF3479675.1 hypothetical protein GIQ15_06651 [Arthroderma uncinatum]